MAVRVVIIGGSSGGLAVARELRHHLGADRALITVSATEPHFTFIPSLTRVATGTRGVDQISLDLAPALASQQVGFVQQRVVTIDPDRKLGVIGQGEYPYDFLVIATGHRSANEAVAGLGPFDGPGHSPMLVTGAVELASAVRALIKEPGPVVVGAAPGASCLGPSYELAFELDHLLCRRKLRHRVPISFVTPEPFLGHMGMGGAGKIRQVLEGAFEKRDISYPTSAAVTKITESAVESRGSGPVPSILSIIVPPLAGVPVVAGTPRLANLKGFIPVDSHCRQSSLDGVYAVGVAVALAPVEETAVAVNFPKTGHMTEQMALIAARDIVARLEGHEGQTAELSARCLLDMGDRGIYLAVDPVRPPRDRIPTVSEGRRWLLVKRAFERRNLWHARRGRSLPTSVGW
ncbi:MAG: FAD-dependent oxidoreductase [Candidatus Dormibacteraeota bacterium]|nr:FAD-dependent oxidoreductase [Candidatus Dormibacteraeota bacterium]